MKGPTAGQQSRVRHRRYEAQQRAKGKAAAQRDRVEHVIKNLDGTIGQKNSDGNDPHPPKNEATTRAFCESYSTGVQAAFDTHVSTERANHSMGDIVGHGPWLQYDLAAEAALPRPEDHGPRRSPRATRS